MLIKGERGEGGTRYISFSGFTIQICDLQIYDLQVYDLQIHDQQCTSILAAAVRSRLIYPAHNFLVQYSGRTCSPVRTLRPLRVTILNDNEICSKTTNQTSGVVSRGIPWNTCPHTSTYLRIKFSLQGRFYIRFRRIINETHDPARGNSLNQLHMLNRIRKV